MTITEYVKGRTDDQLKEEFEQLRNSIEVIECFSVRDLQIFHEIGTELQKRGYEYSEETKGKWEHTEGSDSGD